MRRPDITLALWTRRLPSNVARFARLCLDLADLHIGFEAEAGHVGETLVEAMGDLSHHRDAPAWIADVRQLARLFAWATAARRLHVHVETLSHDACKLFHIDNVRCRLITTYAGPGTEWLPDSGVTRDGLGRGDNDLVCRPGARPRSLRAGWVGLFKGERLPVMQGRGIVHRSAPIRAAGRRRLVLKIGYAGEIICD